MNQSGRDDGFTLVELLVTMLIIGVLCGIAIPVFLTQRHKASATAAKSDLSSIALMARSVELSNGSYPSNFVESLEPASPDPATVYYKKSNGVQSVQSVALPGGGLCLQVTTTSGEVISWTSTTQTQDEGVSCPGL
jgi:prepilin-type N-terminal cleavage/methylation domain-containing protein